MILIWLKHRKTRMLRKQKENTHYEVSEQKKKQVWRQTILRSLDSKYFLTNERAASRARIP